MITLNVAIAVPSGETWPAGFGLSLSTLIITMLQKPVPGYDQTKFKLIHEKSSLLPKSRYGLVQKAIEAGCSHVLFIDSDQDFPGYTLHALARHGKMVVGCNIATKCFPSNPTARNYSADWAGGHKVFTTSKSKGLEQVWRLGFGIILINLDVFKQIPKPWFEIKYNAKVDDYVGEDWYFCELLQKYDIPIFIDHDLSWQIGHIGHVTFTHDMVEVPRVEHRSANNG